MNRDMILRGYMCEEKKEKRSEVSSGKDCVDAPI